MLDSPRFWVLAPLSKHACAVCVRVCEGVCAETKQKSFSGCSGTGWVVSSGRTVAVWRRRSEQLNGGLHVRATGVVCEPREFGSTNRTAKELSPGLWRAHSVRNWVEGFNNMWQSDLKKNIFVLISREWIRCSHVLSSPHSPERWALDKRRPSPLWLVCLAFQDVQMSEISAILTDTTCHVEVDPANLVLPAVWNQHCE